MVIGRADEGFCESIGLYYCKEQMFRRRTVSVFVDVEASQV